MKHHTLHPYITYNNIHSFIQEIIFSFHFGLWMFSVKLGPLAKLGCLIYLLNLYINMF